MRVYTGLDVWSDFGGRFPWKSGLIEVDPGIRMAVVDEGPRSAPLTFLLLHGNPTWGYLYREFIRRLPPRYRVIAPDHVGFGRSDKPRDPRWYTLDRHVDNLGRVLRELQPARVVPVIQDWGGPIGMAWATKHPERIAGVVVLNSWAFVRQPRLKLPWLYKVVVPGLGGRTRMPDPQHLVVLCPANGRAAASCTRGSSARGSARAGCTIGTFQRSGQRWTGMKDTSSWRSTRGSRRAPCPGWRRSRVLPPGRSRYHRSACTSKYAGPGRSTRGSHAPAIASRCESGI